MKLPCLVPPIHRYHSYSAAPVERGARPAHISFTAGWDSATNSDQGRYTTQATARQFLENYSDDLSRAINSPGCTIRVNKGCHQTGAPHFTVDERGQRCRVASWVGTRSVHVPC
jgi:hypothetical protein